VNAVPDSIKAVVHLANDTYKAGYAVGREIGFNEGLQAAQELIGGKAAEQIILERRAKLAAERP
jgi:flagellar biosynthesis/type III secretory pathway protein FliH